MDLAISPNGTCLNGVSLHKRFGPFIERTNLDFFCSTVSAFTHLGGDTSIVLPKSSTEPSVSRLIIVPTYRCIGKIHVERLVKVVTSVPVHTLERTEQIWNMHPLFEPATNNLSSVELSNKSCHRSGFPFSDPATKQLGSLNRNR